VAAAIRNHHRHRHCRPGSHYAQLASWQSQAAGRMRARVKTWWEIGKGKGKAGKKSAGPLHNAARHVNIWRHL